MSLHLSGACPCICSRTTYPWQFLGLDHVPPPEMVASPAVPLVLSGCVRTPLPTRVLTQSPGCIEWRGGNRFLLPAVHNMAWLLCWVKMASLPRWQLMPSHGSPLPFPCSFPSSIRASEYNKIVTWLSNAPGRDLTTHNSELLCCAVRGYVYLQKRDEKRLKLSTKNFQ